MQINHIYTGDAIETLKTLPDQSVDCCVTSPPYWGLRDYGHSNQMGLEKTPEEYISGMVEVFREVKRILKNEGTCWVNIGDSYCSTAPGSMGDALHIQGLKIETAEARRQKRNATPSGMKPKDLVGIPWMLAFALRADGWYLRQDIIWAKPNPMPESVTDRCTKSHEYIFMLSKSQRYFYDANAIKTPSKNATDDQRILKAQVSANKNNPDEMKNGLRPRVDKQRGHSRRHAGFNDRWDAMSKEEQAFGGANKRSVWNVPTKPYSGAHFATFPPELIIDCIKAGCPENGVVLDPFMGAGTTAMVARKLHRNFIGTELNPAYIEIANKRLHKEIGIFL